MNEIDEREFSPMARKTIVTLVDDLTGETAEDISTVEFAVDGMAYELDLTDENSAKLRDTLSPYVRAGRKIGGRRRGGTRPLQPRNAEIDPCVGQAKWSPGQRPWSAVRRGVSGLAERPGRYVPRIGHAVLARRWISHE
jgi:hypothetical protein